MTYAVTNVNAYVREVDEPLSFQYWQYLVINTTGANTNTVYDFGSYLAGSLGTFWTAVGTDGAFGQQALQVMQAIAPMTAIYLGTISGAKIGRIQGGTITGNGQYTETLVNNASTITFNSGDAPTTGAWVLSWILQQKTHGVNVFNPAP
jgi:hypothetical protein